VALVIAGRLPSLLIGRDASDAGKSVDTIKMSQTIKRDSTRTV